jgi:hypothetical protein
VKKKPQALISAVYAHLAQQRESSSKNQEDGQHLDFHDFEDD